MKTAIYINQPIKSNTACHENRFGAKINLLTANVQTAAEKLSTPMKNATSLNFQSMKTGLKNYIKKAKISFCQKAAQMK